jgi:hypothetical protein
LVGCSIGKSAGLAPRSSVSTSTGGALEIVADYWSIGEQSPGFYVLAHRVDCGHSVMDGQAVIRCRFRMLKLRTARPPRRPRPQPLLRRSRPALRDGWHGG